MSQLRHREPILLTLILTKNICLRLVKQNKMNIGRYMFFLDLLRVYHPWTSRL